jgi:hypothetical protein
MKKVSDLYGKPILFTEYGYESTDYNTMGHWKLSKDSLSVNFENQTAAFEAVFDAFRMEEWWKGGFIWKWHLTRNGLNRRNIKAYTPQDKPALNAIEIEFKINSMLFNRAGILGTVDRGTLFRGFLVQCASGRSRREQQPDRSYH